MTLKHEITWDGVAVILALIAGVVFITRLQNIASEAQEKSNAVAIQQAEINVHIAKLDTAIYLLSEIVAERTGTPIPDQMKP